MTPKSLGARGYVPKAESGFSELRGQSVQQWKGFENQAMVPWRHNVQPSTRFGTVLAPKHSGRGLAVPLVTPRPGQQPQFLVTFLRAFRLCFALFSCLVPHCRAAFPCFWVGTLAGRALAPISTAVFTLPWWGKLGPSLSTVLCVPLQHLLFDIPGGFTREGEGGLWGWCRQRNGTQVERRKEQYSPIEKPFYQGLRGNGLKAHLELALPRRNRTRDVPFLITRLNKDLSLGRGQESPEQGALLGFLGAGGQR